MKNNVSEHAKNTHDCDYEGNPAKNKTCNYCGKSIYLKPTKTSKIAFESELLKYISRLSISRSNYTIDYDRHEIIIEKGFVIYCYVPFPQGLGFKSIGCRGGMLVITFSYEWLDDKTE